MTQERASRIQEDIARSRKETNLLLAKETFNENVSDSVQPANAFFLARPSISTKEALLNNKARNVETEGEQQLVPFEVSQLLIWNGCTLWLLNFFCFLQHLGLVSCSSERGHRRFHRDYEFVLSTNNAWWIVVHKAAIFWGDH